MSKAAADGDRGRGTKRNNSIVEQFGDAAGPMARMSRLSHGAISEYVIVRCPRGVEYALPILAGRANFSLLR